MVKIQKRKMRKRKVSKARQFLLIRNPKLFFKYLYAGAKSVILRWPKAPIQKRINGVLFEFDFNLDSVIKLVGNPLKLLLQYLSIGGSMAMS